MRRMPCEALAKQGGTFQARAAKMHYVYLIESESTPGKRYIGYSDELRRRLVDHNSGKNVSTAPYRPWRLRTYLAFSTKAQALSFEHYLKSGSGHAFASNRLW